MDMNKQYLELMQHILQAAQKLCELDGDFEELIAMETNG